MPLLDAHQLELAINHPDVLTSQLDPQSPHYKTKNSAPSPKTKSSKSFKSSRSSAAHSPATPKSKTQSSRALRRISTASAHSSTTPTPTVGSSAPSPGGDDESEGGSGGRKGSTFEVLIMMPSRHERDILRREYEKFPAADAAAELESIVGDIFRDPPTGATQETNGEVVDEGAKA